MISLLAAQATNGLFSVVPPEGFCLDANTPLLLRHLDAPLSAKTLVAVIALVAAILITPLGFRQDGPLLLPSLSFFFKKNISNHKWIRLKFSLKLNFSAEMFWKPGLTLIN